MNTAPNGAADEPPAAEARSADARVGSIRWLCGRERSEREHNWRRSRRAVIRNAQRSKAERSVPYNDLVERRAPLTHRGTLLVDQATRSARGLTISSWGARPLQRVLDETPGGRYGLSTRPAPPTPRPFPPARPWRP